MGTAARRRACSRPRRCAASAARSRAGCKFRNDEERARAAKMGITDLDRKIYELDELARGDVMFAATGVTNGNLLRGVRRFAGGAVTHSIVMRSKSGTVRMVEAHHNFGRKTGFGPTDR